jgi:hypothetical protein
MKRISKRFIVATLAALAFCLAAGCGGAEEQEPRPPQLVDNDTGEPFAKYDKAGDTYEVIGKRVRIPADLILPILNGRVRADWGEPEDLTDHLRPGMRPLTKVDDLDRTKKE